MTHELLKDDNVSKGDDAMDYIDYKNSDVNQHYGSKFLDEDEVEVEDEDEYATD